MHSTQSTSISPHDPKRPLDPPLEPSKPSKVLKTLALEGVEEEREEKEEEESEGGRGGGEGEDRDIMSQNPRIQRYLVAVEYIGTRFSGSQQQPNQRTVVGTLEKAFCEFVGQPVTVCCSSRTDAGVHALSNVCHVDVERTSKRKPGVVLPPHEPGVVRRAVNHFLQKEGDIMVTDVRCVPGDFHARFKALERTYFYRLLSGPEPLSVFEKERAWHVPEKLDTFAMKKACGILVGDHDFSSFRASGCQALSPVKTLEMMKQQGISSEDKALSPVKTLEELHICEVVPSLYFPSDVERKMMNSECSIGSHTDVKELGVESSLGFGQRRQHKCYVITARARSFLYHQVRLLVGVLKSVGTGEITIADVERILNAKSVTAASPMAPACGLYLGHVKYDLPQTFES